MILNNQIYTMKMKLTYLAKHTFLYFFFLMPFSNLFSQKRGLDEQINEAFTPIANWWEGVLHHFPKGSQQ